MKNLCMSLVAYIVLLPACSVEDREKGYEGINRIYLSFAEETPYLEESKASPLTVNIALTNPLPEDVLLDFEVLDDTQGVIRLEGNPVSVGAGETEVSLKIYSNRKNVLTEETFFKLGIPKLPETMKLERELSVRVKPDAVFMGLDERQKKLIASYKSKFGIDLADWMGVVTCRTKVMSPASERSISFAQAFTKEYDGKTIITLSEKATEDMPVLKMETNPFGLNEYMGWVLQRETVFNDEYWFVPEAGPNYKAITELLDWNKQNPGIFTMKLDNIKLFDISDGKADLFFFGIKLTGGGDETETVPFEYCFTPWEKQKKLIAEGNETAKELEAVDGTADPAYYLMTYSVMRDEIKDKINFVKPEGRMDFKNKKMTFRFSFSHSLADGYTRIYTTYEKK